MPLCENMPSGSASKPGDVVTAMNGKTIQVCNGNAVHVMMWATIGGPKHRIKMKQNRHLDVI